MNSWAVETFNGKDIYRVSLIYSNKWHTKKLLKHYTRFIDRDPLARVFYGPPENLYIWKEKRGDEMFFGPYIGDF